MNTDKKAPPEDIKKKPRKKGSTPRGLTPIGTIAQRRDRTPSVKDPRGTTVDVLQYELWTTFWGENKDSLSNTVELWDAIPKFAVHRNKQIELRDEHGRLPMHRAEFVFQETNCRLELQPALIWDGERDLAYYPAGDEELIWEVLIKLFSDQQYGVHDTRKDPPSSYVRFTLRILQRELAKHGHKRSIPQIRHAVEVLSRSVLVIYVGDKKKPLYRAPMLADVADVTRDDYLEDPTRFWLARLPGLISSALVGLNYRQYNYAQSLHFKDPLARWFQKRLTHRHTNASFMNSYHLALSTMEEEGAPFHSDNITRRIKRVDNVLEEMRQANIVALIEKNVQRSSGRGRKIKDAVWTIFPHPSFVGETKAANGRLKDAKLRLSLVGSRSQ